MYGKIPKMKFKLQLHESRDYTGMLQGNSIILASGEILLEALEERTRIFSCYWCPLKPYTEHRVPMALENDTCCSNSPKAMSFPNIETNLLHIPEMTL